ncbi:MAG: DUF819 family protein [Deltaproteobacteria bacterium]|nr:DUF819 family protein [Deltaproteobacteria bacterium]
MIEDTRLVLAMLALCVAVSELLARRTVLRHAGSSLIVIIVAAVLSNLGVIPTTSTPEHPVPAYDAVLGHVAPLAIFWLVLRVDLRRILAAGLPLSLAFGVGALGTVAGVFVGMAVVGPDAFGASTGALGGMFSATYIGGSANFNALALHYGVINQGALYAGTMAVDAGLTAVWMVVTIAVPRLARRRATRMDPASMGPSPSSSDAASGPGVGEVHDDAAQVDPFDLGVLIALGLGALWLSDVAVALLAGWGVSVPGMLVLTTMALGLAQVPAVARLAGTNLLGMFAVQIFLATIGALCDVAAVIELGTLGAQLLVLASVVIGVHGLLVFGAARLLRYGPELAAIASQANIGGGTTALALARSIGRRDLAVPAILVGSLGTALGTFVGFAVAAAL